MSDAIPTAMDTSSGYVLEVRTEQTEAFKTLVEALKEIFKDVMIRFHPKTATSPGGMFVSALNTSTNILVKLNLPADNFEKYVCRPRKSEDYIEVGVNMTNLHKLIKTSNKNDHLTLFVEEDRMNELGIRLDNLSKNCRTTYRLVLLELATDAQVKVGDQSFDFMLTMPSIDFHNVIKNMSIIAEEVDMKFANLPEEKFNLIFSCRGDFASQETIFRDYSTTSDTTTMSVTKINEAPHSIIQGVYELKSLALFSKCATLCSHIDLLIKNNYPLVIRYQVASLGKVCLFLSQINNEKLVDEDSEQFSDESDFE